MGILKGGLSVRRYRAEAPPEDFRDRYIVALEDNAFREPLTETHKEQRVGWVQVHNLLDLAVHLPHIKDYWCKLLLGEKGYRRHTMNIHRQLHGKQRLQPPAKK